MKGVRAEIAHRPLGGTPGLKLAIFRDMGVVEKRGGISR
jgi:hypothetical protein